MKQYLQLYLEVVKLTAREAHDDYLQLKKLHETFNFEDWTANDTALRTRIAAMIMDAYTLTHSLGRKTYERLMDYEAYQTLHDTYGEQIEMDARDYAVPTLFE